MNLSTFIISRFILFVSLLLQFSVPSFAAPGTCQRSLKDWAPVPEGTAYWGTYICKGSGCGIETSAMPDAVGAVRCHNCGKGHSGEPFIQPQIKYRGDQLYVLNPGGVGDTQMANSGLKWQCPECQTTNFRVAKICKNCNEAQPSEVDNYLVNENGQPSHDPDHPLRQTPDASADHSSALAGSSRSNSLETETADAVNLDNPSNQPIRVNGVLKGHLQQQPHHPWKAWLKKGSAVALAITASAIIWGVQTFSEPGIVTDVNGTQIEVSYEHNQQTYSMKLDAETLKSGVLWHRGEPVTLHFTNYQWLKTDLPTAAERSNAEVYQPILLERGGHVGNQGSF